MPYETVQNSTQSNDWIKKSTFWPYQTRVSALVAKKKGFLNVVPFDPLSNHVVFIFTPFGFETYNFAPFFDFFLS